ncbi:MAG: hypothetical protein EOP86_06410 [Verrucomicrobiaceae bacterium]|nr:MAG: hypothetical protein EOP86_06410 [Verrucomicrobiaceae bacterium]
MAASLRVVRDQQRPARRESTRRRHMDACTAQTDTLPPTVPPESALPQVLPCLDEAMQALSGTDRRIVLRRFYAGHALAGTAAALGRSEAAVRKQCQRALEKLGRLLKRRGMPVSASMLAVGLVGALHPSSSAALIVRRHYHRAAHRRLHVRASGLAMAAFKLPGKTPEPDGGRSGGPARSGTPFPNRRRPAARWSGGFRKTDRKRHRFPCRARRDHAAPVR